MSWWMTAALAGPVVAPPAPEAEPAAAPAATGERLLVGTHPIAPFVVHEPDGGWSGISIDLWKQIANDAGVAYEIREYPIRELVTNAPGDIDVVVSMNITRSAEETFDMTHAFLSTGLAIATRPQAPSVVDALGRVLTPTFLGLFGGVAVLLVGAGSLMWLVERRNPEGAFAGGDGWVSGLFWAVETVIGYNDPAHQTRLGRLLGITWAGFGVVVVSTLTAQLSSQLTISGLESAVSGPGDLPRVTVGTVERSAGWKYCERRSMTCRMYPDAEASLRALARGEVDAVVYEAPILQYHVSRTWPDALLVLPGTFDNHGYGFGLAPDSQAREALNRALLDFVGTDAYRTLLKSYLGAAAE